MIYLNYPCRNELTVRYYWKLSDILGSLPPFYTGSTTLGPYSEDVEEVLKLNPENETQNAAIITALNSFIPEAIRESFQPQPGQNVILKLPLPILPTDEDGIKNLTILREFLLRRFAPTYWEKYFATSEENTAQDGKDVYFEFYKIRFIPVLVNTFKKYSELIKIYEASKSNLMGKVKSETIGQNLFNDTPQEEDEGDEFVEFQHTTTATKTKSTLSSDMETPIKRISEISQKIEDFYSAWLSEFDKIFIEEPTL